MTVKELIQQLSQLEDQDQEVWFDAGAVGYDVSSVTVESVNLPGGIPGHAAMLR